MQREAESALEFGQKARFGPVVDIVTGQLGFIRTLRGLTPEFGSFCDDGFDEGRFEQHLVEATPSFIHCWYWIRKLQARFHAGDYAQAVAAAAKARPLLQATSGLFEEADYHFYAALARAAASDSATPDERREHSGALAEHHKRLALWAENCPENFANRAALVGAEIARLDGRELEAERLYEQAIRAAREQGFVQNEGLAYELASRFYAARGFDVIADAYLRAARQCHFRWGALGKVKQLDQLHPRLQEEMSPPGSTSTTTGPVDRLDLGTVLKISQAVSGEMVLEKLIDRLMRAAIEHAGAERGLLIVPRGDELKMEAEATIGGEDVTVHLRDGTHTPAALPESLVRYVMRTQETVILDDASSQNPFSADPYIVQCRARSILSLPLINRATLIGILYLENNLTPRVFTPDRVTVLKVLASQAAMALENSRLYRELQERESKIRRLVDANVVGVLISHLDGQVVEANDAFLDMVGFTRDDLSSGRIKWTELTPAEWQAASQRAVEQLRATGSADLFEKEYFRKDGSRVPVLIAAAALAGTPAQTVAFVVDLRERKAAEEALLRAREELARVTRVSTVGELAASIAHEINQPLAAVATYAGAALQWLGRDTPNVDRARDAVERTVQENEHAGKIVSRVRALVKKVPPRTEPLGINTVVLEVLEMTRNELQRNGISLKTELSADNPLVLGDRVQLQQVLLNLVLNAVDAMRQPGTSPRELSITSRREGENEVFVEVRDSGPGFEAETLDRIFDPFFTTKPDGMGMGLSISRSIVVAHGGRLWAMANEPRGAVFQFALPAAESDTHPKA